MALLKKIKEKLGFGSDSSDGESGETTVTVERDTDGSEPNDRGEPEAGNGTESGTEDDGTGTAAAGVNEANAADDREANAEGETIGDEAAATDGDEEPTEDDADVAEVDDADDSDDADDAVEDEAGAGGEPDESGDEVDGAPVDRIKGIGPAYGERLSKIGIETVEDLAAADPAEVAEGASIGEKRAVKWVDRAKEF
ncbi:MULTISPECIES: helix-hairpin-helix domain-containing protein [Haloferacaceae]|uniref:Helix-hairpin-helix domain-containing protein n=1 Tax=Halorubrum glutamatedens TaxID=2707018 RepID=A0ABD5QUF6_9EURY|nr:helix-hairpin-helix domain-containing protein [Halobellus captivus]